MRNQNRWLDDHKTVKMLEEALAKEKVYSVPWARLALARFIVGLRAEAVARGLA